MSTPAREIALSAPAAGSEAPVRVCPGLNPAVSGRSGPAVLG